MVIFKACAPLANGMNSCQCFWAESDARLFQPLVEGRARHRREEAEDRQAGRPRPNLLHRSLGHSNRVVVHTEIKDVMA